MDEGPRISLPESIIIALAIFVVGLLDFIPLIGPLFDFALTQLYLRFKHVQGQYQHWMLIANGASELDSVLPVGDIFDPLIDAITFIVISWIINHPSEITEVVEKAAAVTETVEGKGGGEEAVAGEAAAAKAAGAAEGEAAAAAGGATAAGAKTGGKAAQAGEAGEQEPSGKEGGGGEETAKKQKLEEEMEVGAEKSPEKEMEGELFNPQETQFQEAPALGSGGSRDTEPGATGESEAEKEEKEMKGERKERIQNRAERTLPKREEDEDEDEPDSILADDEGKAA